jgi:nucleoid-associated protein YgaU
LSKIGSQYGVSWQKIFEANRDKLDDPDKIQPGQELTIPQG